MASRAARKDAGSAPGRPLALKWMLPSPTWPNATTTTSGTSSRISALPRSSSSGTRDTGTEMSCLMLALARFCASGTVSRRRHSACACALLSAITASSTPPSSNASASVASSAPRSPPSSPPPEISTSR